MEGDLKDQEIVDRLVQVGYSENRARSTIAELRFALLGNESEVASGASNDFLWGVIWLAGGGIATAVTYSMAAPGGTYFMFWGAMLYGGWRLLKGVVKSSGG